ncbi:cupin domain-containing protein [Lysobacter sp. KIS68-7]|uniref:(R)-mandelonitrile lyase n=1 Tax=Lysobacter sp. KIS68-7 TaxID=2904252 RepID=UPI001E498AB0|nr:cupin domain-containing protein [Lysobacter sp. KIS68-7]UHQ19014.1 cupin domain-containing protein [Lysobacter sp. KIS68-7]
MPQNMKSNLRSFAAPAALLSAAIAAPPAIATEAAATPTITVTPGDARSSISGPSDWFTGNVRVTPMFAAEGDSRMSGASVTFQPGARTAWHTHPLGQTLIVTDGEGFVQQFGQPAQRMSRGDVVRIPAGVKHWHGASTTTSLTHVALQEALDGKVVDWLEHVSDVQYRQND